MPSSATAISSCSTPKRRVSFKKHVTVIKVRHHRQYSDREFQSYWHTLDDYLSIREEVKQTIEYYKNGLTSCSSSTLDEEPTFCLRGLEDRTSSERSLKAILRREAWHTVLEEQDIQYDLGSPDSSDIVRQVYQIFSLPASRIAQRKGVEDAMEAAALEVKYQPSATSCVAKENSSSKTTTSSSPATGGQTIIKKSIVPHAA